MNLAPYVGSPKQFRKLGSYLLTNLGVPDHVHEAVIATWFPCDCETAARVLGLCGFRVSAGDTTEWAADDRHGIELVDGERKWTERNLGEFGCVLLENKCFTDKTLARIVARRTFDDDLANTAAQAARTIQTGQNYACRN